METAFPPLASFAQLPAGQGGFRIGADVVRFAAVDDGWAVTSSDPAFHGHLSAETTTVIGEHAIELRLFTYAVGGDAQRQIEVDVHEFKDLFI
ncbi:hypothetical protein SCB71_20065 [Herbiconiux sp. KACC 21604]|uniref:hypothetical protein n=1 Tax=unclassified Herbiconiux TaxID=2618217 RepID=UPI001491C6D3|nr:hypothetical protein [Herbiconiux sp. SALV-R1]QJU55324.1 hypothetical protein HL652_17995 [Herbiconiux sp. SALV-R1]WPO86492.1 hypothetical protein SCB71_20065 [Herbiconiux sp. KACC 21604]